MVSINPQLSMSCTNFDEYRAYYLATRRNLWTRRSHVLATALAAISAVLAAIRLDVRMIASSVAAGYLLCWGADAAIEQRRPASIDHPIWAFRANMMMVRDVMTGNQSV